MMVALRTIYCDARWEAPLDPPVREWTVNTSPLESPGGEHRIRITTTSQEWTNLNYFFARLISALNPGTHHLKVEAATGVNSINDFFFIRSHLTPVIADALEFMNRPEQMTKILPAVACWFVYSPEIYRRFYFDVRYPLPETRGQRDVIVPGPLYTGKGLISEDRWNFWKSRFSAFEQDRRLSLVTRDWARKAVESMTAVEAKIPPAQLIVHPGRPPFF